MKFSLISATSIVALFSAAIGPANAGVQPVAPGYDNIYDLVRDGVTSSDGGDATVVQQDRLITAATALRAASGYWQTASFTGPIDPTAGFRGALPNTPLAAARGAKPDEYFASAAPGSADWTPYQRARALGQARIASLIGSIASSARENAGGTVFVTVSKPVGPGDVFASGGVRGTSTNYAFASTSTSTTAITISGSGNLSRQSAGGLPYVSAMSSLRVAAPAQESPVQTASLSSETIQQARAYQYAPTSASIRDAGGKANLVAAAFSDAFTPSTPSVAMTSGVRTTQVSELRPVTGSTVAANGKESGLIPGIGAGRTISASVSANPSAAAARLMASIADTARPGPANKSVEAFQIGAEQTAKQAATTVSDPLRGKILASSGPLNNSLALP